MKSINVILFIISTGVNMVYSSPLRIGLFPKTFPRDPVEVNLFLEHTLLGQILEPLVEVDKEGRIVPGVASRWDVSLDSKTIIFEITPLIRFSNGTLVTSEDVKYSLERHIYSATSQSKAYLKNIVAIKIMSASKIKLELDVPCVAIFKVLSRDQLGIVPKGWKFDPTSAAPFVGTGPYQAQNINDEWHLVKNKFYRESERVKTEEWIVTQSENEQHKGLNKLPDIIPFIDQNNLDLYSKNKEFKKSDYDIEEISHFTQSIAWWNPLGKNTTNKNLRLRGMAAMNTWIESAAASKDLRLATGFIPDGIPGHLRVRTIIPFESKNKAEPIVLTVAVFKREMSVLNQAEIIKKTEMQYNLKIKLIELDYQNFTRNSPQNIDIVIIAFAGGFQDPDGFLAPMTALFKKNFSELLGTHFEQYIKASQNTNWTERAKQFSEISQALNRDGIYVPGWKLRMFSLKKKNMSEGNNYLRYSPRFADFFLRKEAL